MRRLLVPLAVATVAAASLTACGTSSSPKGGGAARKPTPVQLSGRVTNNGTKDVSASGAIAAIAIEAHDFSFNPSFVKATPGATVTVQLKNAGTSQHTFTIDALGVDKSLDPGSSTTVTVLVPSSGALGWYCRFHRSQGMQGAFFSQSGQAAVGANAPAAGGSTGASSSSTSAPTTSTTRSSGGRNYGY